MSESWSLSDEDMAELAGLDEGLHTLGASEGQHIPWALVETGVPKDQWMARQRRRAEMDYETKVKVALPDGKTELDGRLLLLSTASIMTPAAPCGVAVTVPWSLACGQWTLRHA